LPDYWGQKIRESRWLSLFVYNLAVSENELEQLGTDISKWTFIKRIDPRLFDGYLINGFYSERYEIKNEAGHFTMGRFYLNGTEVYRAWGRFSDEHCSFHAMLESDGALSEPISGCPNVSLNQQSALLVLKTSNTTISLPIEILEQTKTKL